MSTAPEILLASAGSGKTYQLSSRFLALLAGGAAPDRILATTFTRKAAGEILHRVLQRLASTAQEEAPSRALLARLMRELHRFDVRTLDSLFVELAGQLGGELGLPPGWTLVDEAEGDALAGQAIGELIGRSQPGALVALLADLGGGEPGRSVHEKLLRSFGSGAGSLRKLFLAAPRASWGALRLPEPAPRAALAAACRALKQTVRPTTKAGKPRVHFSNALDRLCALVGDGREALTLEEARALLADSLCARVLSGGTEFSGAAIEPDLAGVVRALCEHAASLLAADAARRGRALGELLALHDACWTRLQRERGLYDFDDLPAALAGAAEGLRGERADFLRGAPIEHLLLDEFQDTSPAQWRVLQPLADAVARGGRGAFFCVGDVKQAIYGWRGGDSALLAGLPAAYGVPARSLAASWRSSREVLDAVNRVFGTLAANPVLGELGLEDALPSWVRPFEAHAPAPARPDVPPGDVRVLRVESPKRGARRGRELGAAAARLVQRLRAEHPDWRIGVLVRRNARIPPVLDALQRLGLPATGEGGHELTDSAAVRLLLSLLHLADHPGDGEAAFHVATSALGPLAGLGADLAGAARVARRVRAELLGQGYGPWLEARRAELLEHGELRPWDVLRVQQLVELGHAYDARAGLRPSDFVALVRRKRVEVPASVPIVVTTTHQAKGLEYDAVVLAELDDEVVKERQDVLVGRSAQGAVEFIVPSPGKAAAALVPDLARAVQGRRAAQLEAALCALYVGMTRAKRQLHLLVPSTLGPKSNGALVCAAVGVPAEDDVPATAPGAEAARRAPGARAPAAAPAPAPQLIRLRRGARPRALRRVAPSSHGERARGARERLGERTGLPRVRGLVMHAWLERIGWLEEGLPDEAALLDAGRRVARAEGCDEALVAGWLAEWRERLARPAVREALSRAAQRGPEGAEPELHAEQAFARLDRVDGEAVLVRGCIDRLVLWRRGGAVVAAEVIDLKTDSIAGEALAERAARHAPQMAAYRAAVMARHGLPAGAVTARLLFVEAGESRVV